MNTVTTPAPVRKPARPAKPVAGLCRWFERPDPDGHGLLLINDVLYAVGPNQHRGQLLGWYVRNLDTDTLYAIDATLAALGLLPVAPPAPEPNWSLCEAEFA
jgi:hypothetical protein